MKNTLALILMLSVFNAHAYGWTGNVNFFLGQKALEEEDWAPADEQTELGVLLDFKKENWPVSFAIDFLGSNDESTELGITLEGTTTELDVGVRKIFDTPGSQVKPYIGGGIAFIGAEAEGRSGFLTVTEDDNATGIWLNGGVYWTLAQHFNIGFDLRYSRADVTLFGVEVDAGGAHVGLLLGYHW